MSFPLSPLPSGSPAPPPRLSVIIPLFNCLPLTQAMFASLQATMPATVSYEVIFVDDGSTDGTREWLKNLPAPSALTHPRAPLRAVLNDRNLGFAISNNRAIAGAHGDFLALLNNDLVLEPNWLEPMLAAHRRLGPRAGLIGNIQRNFQTHAIDHTGIIINHQGKPVHDRARPTRFHTKFSQVRRVPAVTGACLLLTRKLWQTLGGFDEGFVNGGEDVDLCFRAREHGHVNAVALASTVLHHISSSAGRKLRDEENSRRLLARWRRAFALAADEACRDWCRAHFERILIDPRTADPVLARHAWFYALGLTRTPPLEAIAFIEAGQNREFARWDSTFTH